MRILIAHSFYRKAGGEDVYVRQEADLLRDDHEVDLLARYNEDLKSGLSTGLRMTYSRRLVEQAEQRIKNFRPDVIHLHNAYPALGPAIHLAARKQGIPLVMTVHNYRLRCPNGYMFTEGQICGRCIGGNHLNAVVHHCFPERKQAAAYAASLWLHRFVFSLERDVTRFICPSRFMQAQLVKWGIEEDRTTVIRNFTPISPPGPSSQLGTYGLYLGRLSSEKGLLILAEALRAADDPPFVVAGDGPMRKPLTQLIRSLGLERVRLVGALSRKDVSDLLLRARFVVFPSLCHENAPLAALEAMACGKPTIVSQVGGLAELVEQGGGLAVKAGDVGDLAGAMARVADDDTFCRESSERARSFAVNYLGPDAHKKLLEQAFRTASQGAMTS